MSGLPPLLLVPGLLCDAALWQFQLSALADLAEPVVADVTEASTIGAMAAAILSTAPRRFSLAGLSMGGYVAFEILRRAPDRVTHAAFIDTQAIPDSPASKARRLALLKLAERGRFKGVTPRLLPQLLHPDHQHSALAQIVLDMAERVGPAAFARQQAAIMDRADSRSGLAAIDIPVTVICGDADLITPPVRAQEIADGIAGADLVIIERAGHLSPLEHPEAVNRALIELLSR